MKKQYFLAATLIQAAWRGWQQRKYIQFLHNSATIVQSAYRGFKGRQQFQLIVKKARDKMRTDCYANMAIRIQSRWRGYFTRKYTHNYYARKTYLDSVLRRNAEVREALAQYLESQQEEKERENRRCDEQEKLLQARRLHYMRSTYQINGVFASPWFPQNDFEKMLASVTPLSKEERDKLFPSKTADVHQTQKLPPIKNPPMGKLMQGSKMCTETFS